MTFTNQTIIITGASSGIGKALALKLSTQNAKLVLAARNKSALEITAQECIDAGGKAIIVPTDVADPDACKNLIAKSLSAFGEISCLINNAGIGMWAKFEQIEDISIFEQIMQVNYLGSVYCTHYALPYLKKSKGLLVGISSLTGFFDSLRIELTNTGVNVLVVSPGFVATDIRQHTFGARGKVINTHLHNENQKAMSLEVCTDLIMRAMIKRQRELVMTWEGKLGLWLKLLFPGLVDRIADRAVSSQKHYLN